MYKRHMLSAGRIMQVGVLVFLFLLTVSGSSSLAQEPPVSTAESHIVGFRLPNAGASIESVQFAGIGVNAIETIGCPRELAHMLVDSLATDETCRALLMENPLDVLDSKNIIRLPMAQQCGSPTIKLPASDFVKVHKRLQAKTPQAQRESKCEITSQACISPKGASFELTCGDDSVTVSTEGSLNLSTRAGTLTLEVPQ